MRILIFYYSFTGNSRKIAEHLSQVLDARVCEVTCPAYGYAPWGGLRQAWHVLTGGTPPIEMPDAGLKRYDLVVFGGPVWAARPAPPLRAMIKRLLPFGAPLAAFVSCDGTSEKFPPEKAIAELKKLGGERLGVTHIFREATTSVDGLKAEVAAFAAQLLQMKA